MAEQAEVKMVPTLGLTGVTVNAMALTAPGAFLWITFVVQAGHAFPSGIYIVGTIAPSTMKVASCCRDLMNNLKVRRQPSPLFLDFVELSSRRSLWVAP